MNRRQYAAMSVGVVGGPLAGCTTVAGETELTEPTESREDHSVRFVYDHEGETLARVNFNTRPDTPWKPINEIPESPAFHRLRVGTEQPGDVELDSYRFRFEPVAETPVNVYLQPPELGHEDTFDTYRDADRTVVGAAYDGGTPVGTSFEVLVHGGRETATGSALVGVDYELTLSGDGYFGETFLIRDTRSIERAAARTDG